MRGSVLRMAAIGMALGVVALAGSSAGAAILNYSAALSGANESPANASPGTGIGLVDIDTTANTMRVRVTFSGLIGTTTAAHIHAATTTPGVGTAGVATTTPTFAGFPTGVTSGSYDNTLDLGLASSYNPSYVTANGGTPATAAAALLASIAAGTSYLNVHSSTFGGGEIRGFLTLVPAPSAAGLLALGGLMMARRRR